MKKPARCFLFPALLMLLAFGPADARAMKSGAESTLNREMTLLDRTASSPRGEQAATDELVRTFDTTKDRVAGFRSRHMGFGEIAALFASAGSLEGGLTDANVKKVADLRQGNSGWVQIARVFNLDLDAISRKVGGIAKDVRGRLGKGSG